MREHATPKALAAACRIAGSADSKASSLDASKAEGILAGSLALAPPWSSTCAKASSVAV